MTDLSAFFDKADIYMGQTKRADCPVCKRKNTFTYTREYYGCLYNCYSADCKTSGVHRTVMSSDSLRNAIIRTKDTEIPIFEVPDYFKPITSSTYCVNMLDRYGCSKYLEHYEQSLRYDPKEDRLVFLIHNPACYTSIDAVGRSLSSASPKWKRYGKSSRGFHVNGGNITIVVEDCFSAANLYGDFEALALMGTTLTYEHIKTLINCINPVVICLDKDATSKALEMRKVLRPLLWAMQKLKVHMLQKDIKNMTPAEREEFVSKINGMFS